MSYREESDSMGTLRVPVDAYYGAQTQRAVENFPIGGMTMPIPFIRALAWIKRSAAQVNTSLGAVAGDIADAVVQAADDVLTGNLDDQFVVDVYQTGSGTSSNMNMNEVIAGRANEILTGNRGGRTPVHPNDHVNWGQSSNDVVPSAIHVAAAREVTDRLRPALEALAGALEGKADAFREIPKLGRTHLQDAVPMTLGQEFSGYARQVVQAVERLDGQLPRLCELALGGTAVGTGLNTHPDFARQTIARLSEDTGIAFVEAPNHFAAQAAQDTIVELSGLLRATAVSMIKISNDIRWMASGPRSGLGEITIPSLQPGSSIMPGKVNPVVPEAVIQACVQVMGNDLAVGIGGTRGNFELNVAMPLIAHNVLQSVHLLSGAAKLLEEKCVSGIEANRKTCEGYIENSLALVTGFVPHIGYDRAAAIAKEALASGRTVREVISEAGIVSGDVVNEVLGPPADGEEEQG